MRYEEKKTVSEKLEWLKQYLKELGSVAVAFSGGVDSAFLLKTAQDVPGIRVIAVTVQADSFPARELDEAKAFCRQYGIQHEICQFDILKVDGFCQNPPDRCYLCKRALLETIRKTAEARQAAYIIEGSNLDDDGDYRPGRQAVAELGIKSPLREAGMTKAEIRMLSREQGLASWDKPSFACLASRFPYGEMITAEKLSMVEKAEQFLLEQGFRQVRVRIHGSMARIEIQPEEFAEMMKDETRRCVVAAFKTYGFTHTSLDLSGYRTGSMNEALCKAPKENGAVCSVLPDTMFSPGTA